MHAKVCVDLRRLQVLQIFLQKMFASVANVSVHLSRRTRTKMSGKKKMVGKKVLIRSYGDSDQIETYKGGDIWIERITSGDTAGGVRTNVPRIEYKHSPTGFNFGYAGSGPADFALNVMLMFCKSREDAHRIYQQFKFQFVASGSSERLVIPAADIISWIQSQGAESKNHLVNPQLNLAL